MLCAVTKLNSLMYVRYALARYAAVFHYRRLRVCAWIFVLVKSL